MRSFIVGTSLFVAGALCAGTLLSQEDWMKAWQERNQKSDWHKRLSQWEGEWTYKDSMWMAPGEPAIESNGTANYNMVLNGRYLKSKIDSKVNGEPYEGAIFLGYDTANKRFVSVCLDTMTNVPMMQFGTAGADGNTITFTGEVPDPMTGRMKKMRSVLDLSSKDKITCEGFSTGKDGKEFKCYEATYKREARN